MASLTCFEQAGLGVGPVVPAGGVFLVLLLLVADQLYLFGLDCHRTVREMILYIPAAERVPHGEN